ncbi:MAG: hypothetical protein P4L16_07580 [Chlamydiales bacterium]|nr:hypothetical protein [Chlamydiales bacterium]
MTTPISTPPITPREQEKSALLPAMQENSVILVALQLFRSQRESLADTVQKLQKTAEKLMSAREEKVASLKECGKRLDVRAGALEKEFDAYESISKIGHDRLMQEVAICRKEAREFNDYLDQELAPDLDCEQNRINAILKKIETDINCAERFERSACTELKARSLIRAALDPLHEKIAVLGKEQVSINTVVHGAIEEVAKAYAKATKALAAALEAKSLVLGGNEGSSRARASIEDAQAEAQDAQKALASLKAEMNASTQRMEREIGFIR